MKGLFRRNKPNQEGNKKSRPANASSLNQDSHHEDVLPSYSAPSYCDSASAPGGIWYKRPMTTANGESDAHSHFDQHQRVIVPSSSQSTHTGSSRRKTDRKGEAYSERKFKKETGLFRRQKKRNGYSENRVSTNILIASFLERDWTKAFSMIESQPDLVWQQDAIFLHGHKTTALPLHIACCVDVPLSLFDEILFRFPQAAQQTDEVMGRLPLHWACISNASSHILEKLIQTFPDACKSYDLTGSRSPLHYLTIYASAMDQFQPLLAAPVNHKRIMQHADKEGMTPLVLARSTNSPIKAEIVVTLVHHEQIALSNTHQSKELHGQKERTSVPEYVQGQNQAHAPTRAGSKVLPFNARGEIHSVTRQSYGISPTPGAQAYAFSDHDNETYLPALPPKRNAARGPRNVTTRRLDSDSANNIGNTNSRPLAGDCDRVAHRHSKDQTDSALNGATKQQQILERLHAVRLNTARVSPDSSSNSYTKDVEKTDSLSEENKGANVEYEGAKFAVDQKRSAESMMDKMFLNMHQLEDVIKKLKADLNEKDVDMNNLKVVAKDMVMREQNLLLALENSRSVVYHQHEKLNQKRETVELLKDKILMLQAELLKEESILVPMEKTIMLLEQEVLEKEQRLEDHHEEQASFEAMRQAILQEKGCISRDLENSNSELQSLKAIQHLAEGREDEV
jgi:hypothetical protein